MVYCKAQETLSQCVGPFKVTPVKKAEGIYISLNGSVNFEGLFGIEEQISKNKNSGDRI